VGEEEESVCGTEGASSKTFIPKAPKMLCKKGMILATIWGAKRGGESNRCIPNLTKGQVINDVRELNFLSGK